ERRAFSSAKLLNLRLTHLSIHPPAMRHSALDFVVSQWKTLELVVIPDLAGKTVVVIEANTGLGFEAAEHFARMGPGKLILGCRSEARGSAALEKLKQDTGYATAKLWIIDLADFASVTLFADRF
ncbi:unnamed protein product, partial [Mycena citricolor]